MPMRNVESTGCDKMLDEVRRGREPETARSDRYPLAAMAGVFSADRASLSVKIISAQRPHGSPRRGRPFILWSGAGTPD